MKSTYSENLLNLIVPIECGSKKGTAFFISPTQLLTARHVVISALTDNGITPILAHYNYKQIVCTAEQLGEDEEQIDVALLTCHDFILSDNIPLKLLCSNFTQEMNLSISGYPEELGNNIERFNLDISCRGTVGTQDYDMILIRKDPLAFHKYDGFSGSPVLNTFGTVVGIVAVKHNNVLGGISINSLGDALKRFGIVYSDQWELEDITTLGMGRCQRMMEKCINYAGSRYSRELHQSDPEMEKYMLRFLDYNSYFTWETKITEIENWVKNRSSAVATPLSKEYEHGNYIELAYHLENCNEEKIPDNDSVALREKRIASKYLQELNQLHEYYKYSSQKVLLLKGKAGMGKTHTVCQMAESLCAKTNLYLTFGSQYNVLSDAFDQMLQLIEFTEDNLKELNDLLYERQRFSLFIIDALNEGAGDSYWRNHINILIKEFAKYDNLKLVVTIREPMDEIIFSGVEEDTYVSFTINGFYDAHKAVISYFNQYGIPKNLYDPFKLDFQNPLFLRTFCIAFYRINPYYRQSIDRLILFDNYLNYRNETVSVLCDEDPRRNVTSKYLNKVAKYSAFYADCDQITRTKARIIADQCCRGRTWSNNLLHAILTENLLMDAYGIENGRFIDTVIFEFENMGDFLKARAIHESKMSDEACIEFLITTHKRLIRYKDKNANFSAFYNMLAALISIWKRPLNLLQKKAFTEQPFKEQLINSIIYRGQHNLALQSWILDNFSEIDFITFYRYYPYFSTGNMKHIHEFIKIMPMPERDEFTSVKLNNWYDNRPKDIGIEILNLPVYNDNIAKNLSYVLCWMCSSSYPELRAYATRKLYKILRETPTLIQTLIDDFNDVDDPYVLQSLYAAIYGFTLICTDSTEIEPIAESIFNKYYADKKNVPFDLVVRIWSLKIIERAHALNPNSKFWGKSSPPYLDTPNPSDWIDNNIDINYFGESDGSQRIYKSIFGKLDFDSYIIGTNNNVYSPIFHDKNGNSISLSDIQKMIAYVIKNQLDWNENLAQYDNGKSSSNRHYNIIERIGKKYQWIAYYRVMALLADHNYVNASGDRFSSYNGYRLPPYPWYLDRKSCFDPTLESSDTLRNLLNLHLQPSIKMEIGEEEPYEWVKNHNNLPQLNFIIKDDDNIDWVMLSSYDSTTKNFGKNEALDLYIFTNACFVHKHDEENFIKWASTQNFYGSWMPEPKNGGVDFLWNEYPWADSYHYLDYQREIWTTVKDSPCNLMVSYESQLQENRRGLINDNYPSTVLMPCVEMMNELDLYTAERGIIRRKCDHSIAAINRSPYMDDHEGLFIHRSLLNQYLESKGYIMFYYTYGEKMYRISTTPILRELSAFHRYQLDGEMTCIQPLHVIEDNNN